jgi:hypothetical protein
MACLVDIASPRESSCTNAITRQMASSTAAVLAGLVLRWFSHMTMVETSTA